MSMMSTSFQPLCSSAGSLPHVWTAQGCTVCPTCLGRAAGEPVEGGRQLGTEASQLGCGRTGDAASPWEPQLPNLQLTTPERCITLPAVQDLAAWFSLSGLGMYAEISATGEGLPGPTAPLHQPAWLSPLRMHSTRSQLQGEGVRESRAVVQSKTSVLPFQCKEKTGTHPDKSQPSPPP